MRRKAVLWFSGMVFLWLLPYFFTIFLNGADMAFLNRFPDVEDYLPAVLSCQIPDNYEIEAVKAQSVIARTNLCRKIENKDIFAETLNEIADEIKQNHDCRVYLNPIYENAVKATEGKVLTADGELKLIPYHEISSGKTRDGAEALHDKNYSYLKSVDSIADKDSPFFLNSTYIPAQQMPDDLKVCERAESGYVVSLSVDGNTLEGESFARGLGLSSSDFTIRKIGSDIRFLCRGRGHGLGLSQYGGNTMAKEGCSWEEILETYFPAMEQTDLKNIE